MTELKDFIEPLTYRSLRGRVLKMPAQAKTDRKILFIYGSHASLERLAGVVELLAENAQVTAPDLPGFGGMDPLYKLKQPASFDNLAAYVAWYVKKNYEPGDKLTIIGMSLGFAIVTRMLQNHPDMNTYFDQVISYVGFADHDNFKMKKWQQNLLALATKIMETRVFSWLMLNTFCTRPILKLAYGHTKNEKFAGQDFTSTLDMEVKLWRENDVQTYNRTVHEMFRLHDPRPAHAPVFHVAMSHDRYFANQKVVASMRRIFTDVTVIQAPANNHAPSVIANAETARAFIPTEMLALIKR